MVNHTLRSEDVGESPGLEAAAEMRGFVGDRRQGRSRPRLWHAPQESVGPNALLPYFWCKGSCHGGCHFFSASWKFLDTRSSRPLCGRILAPSLAVLGQA